MARLRIKFKSGDRVKIPAVGELPTQYGEVIGAEVNGVVTVRVDEHLRQEDDRDGLCEVPVKDCRPTTIGEDRACANNLAVWRQKGGRR